MQKIQPESLQPLEKTILIVDDDRDIGEVLRSIILDQTRYRVVWIAESDLALEAAAHLKPSLILLDYMMPTLDGLQLFDYLQELEHMRDVPVVLISARASLPIKQLRERGISFLRKPFEMDELMYLIKHLIGETT
ncbi:MAG TPA: response regulator [Ktedonobacteraceae bacterium]|nr:response regulator [Ktedonobacteraceae bacterium]